MKKILMVVQYRKLLGEFLGEISKEKLPDRAGLIYQFLRGLKKQSKKRRRAHLKAESVYTITPYLENLSCRYRELKRIINRESVLSAPIITNRNLCIEELSGRVPEVIVTEIEKCYVYAKSTSVSDGEKIYNKTLYETDSFKYDSKNPVLYGFESLKDKRVKLYTKTRSAGEIQKIYVHLLADHSRNYFHWLFELMPKLVTINQLLIESERAEGESYALLVDEGLPQQFYEMIAKCVEFKHEIRVLSNYERLEVERLIYCTDFWVSLDNTKFKADIVKEFFVDKYAVELVREAFEKYLNNEKPYRKIYLARAQKQLRGLMNGEELEEYLIQEGFEVLSPEKLTFVEQMKLFNDASIVVGTSGAAFSNIIFMQEGTHAVIFSPYTVSANYYIFQAMADVSGVTISHILTEQEYTGSIHSEAIINVADVKKEISALS